VAQTLLAAVVTVYLVVTVAASLVAAAKNEFRLLPLLPPAFVIIHLAYGAGFLLGLLKFWKRWGDRSGQLNGIRLSADYADFTD